MNNFVGDGEMLNPILTEDVLSGDVVVMGSKAGIALTDGTTGQMIPVRMTGVVNLPLKAAGGDLAMGTIVVWDAANGQIAPTAAIGDIENFAYVAEENSVAADATVCVKLTESAQVLKTA